MKVGVFIKNFRPEIGGGSTFETEVLRSLIKYSVVSGHTFVVLSWVKELEKELLNESIQFLPLQGSYLGLSLEERIQYKFVKTVNSIFERLQLNGQLPIENLVEKFIIKNGIEVMWYLELGTYDYPTMELPYITTVWDLEHRNQPHFPEVSSGGRWENRESSYGIKIRRAAMIITGTEAGRSEIERFCQVAPERIKVLPYPTPAFALNATASSEQEVLTKYNIPENYLFYPAQFWPHKNHAGLLLALQLLRDEYGILLPVVFVGSNKGNQDHVKKLVAELQLSTQVHFLGFVPQSDLVSLYQHAFALVFTTLFGPDNLPPLEAFALGCPVIASNVAGAQEQLGDAALLVDPKDEKQIALAIKSLCDRPELRSTLVQRGLQRASQWTGQDYIKGVFSILTDFERIRRCWSRDAPFRQR